MISNQILPQSTIFANALGTPLPEDTNNENGIINKNVGLLFSKSSSISKPSRTFPKMLYFPSIQEQSKKVIKN